jgi:hypothetical protein
MVYLVVTNDRDKAAMIDSYFLERSEAPTGPWEQAQTYGTGFQIFIIDFQHRDRSTAIDVQRTGLVQQIMGHDIPAGGHVEGWALLHDYGTPSKTVLRLTLRSGKIEESFVVPTEDQRIQPQTFAQMIPFQMAPGVFDLSTLRMQIPDLPDDAPDYLDAPQPPIKNDTKNTDKGKK